MEDLEERQRRGETRDFYRVPSKGKTAGSKRIAEAVDNEEWQKVRHSMKGTSTVKKLETLKDYWWFTHDTQIRGSWVSGSIAEHADCDICIRVDNYIKALCRGGQLYGGESLESAIEANWDLKIKS